MGGFSCNRKKAIVVAVIVILVVVIVVLSVTLTLKKGGKNEDIFKSGAVASDAPVCSQIGADVLKENGSAVDSAIATLFCLGVVNLHSCGIGGGGFMVVYIKGENKYEAFDYRETAPANATEEMYVNSTLSSTVGGGSIAIPGEVKGFWTVHQKYGKLKWARLLEPSIKLAEDGFKITKSLDKYLKSTLTKLERKNVSNSGLRDLLTKSDGTALTVGDTLRNPKLAETLRNIQQHNITDFYEGELAKRIVDDIQKMGGIITLEDLKNYEIATRETLKFNMPNNLTLTAMSAPSGGGIVMMIMNIMSGYKFSKEKFKTDDGLLDFYQKLIESMKFSYAQRGFLGDPKFLPKENVSRVQNKAQDPNFGDNIRKTKLSLTRTFDPSYYGGSWAEEDHGTSHLSVVGPNGDAVAATATVNFVFGSLMYSPITGILYNNEMDDFSTPGVPNGYGYPPSPANFIRPGKRPLSSMSPIIVTDSNANVKMVCGGSGGSRIISGTAHVLAKRLLVGLGLRESIETFRLHHQGVPNTARWYNTIEPPKKLIDALNKIGHVVTSSKSRSIVQGIYVDGSDIYAVSDPRKGGKAAGF